MISGIRPLLLLLLLIVFLPTLLRAQDGSAPRIRMLGSTADSVTGGPPSVMVGRISSVEYHNKKRNLVGADPIKSLYYYNVSYFRALDYSWMVGGTVQFAPGFIGDSLHTRGFGIQAGAKYFFPGEGPRGWHADATLHFYSLRLADKDQTPVSFTLDGGYLWDLGPLFIDFKLGVEYFLVPLEERGEDYQGEDARSLLMIGEEGRKFTIHNSLLFGVNF